MQRNLYVVIYLLCFICVIETIVIFKQVKKIKRLQPKYKFNKVSRNKVRFTKSSMEKLDALDGIQFEDLCCSLLHELGFSNIRKTRVTGDFGLDILCTKSGIEYGIQCKCYSSTVGIDAVQQAYSGGAYYGCDEFIVMSNQYFTDAAQELARVIGVGLWSRNFFIEQFNNLKRSRVR